MTTAFVPRDGIAQWRRVLTHIIELQPGEEITHEQLEQIIGDTYRPGHHAILRAARELRLNHQRSLTTVIGRGYRVLHPTEHIVTSERAVRRSRRALTRAHEEVASADRRGLTMTQAKVMDQRELALARITQTLKQDVKQAVAARKTVDISAADAQTPRAE